MKHLCSYGAECPWSQDEDAHVVQCGPWHYGHTNEVTHQHRPKIGMGGNNPESRIVALLDPALHDAVDNGLKLDGKLYRDEVRINEDGHRYYRLWQDGRDHVQAEWALIWRELPTLIEKETGNGRSTGTSEIGVPNDGSDGGLLRDQGIRRGLERGASRASEPAMRESESQALGSRPESTPLIIPLVLEPEEPHLPGCDCGPERYCNPAYEKVSLVFEPEEVSDAAHNEGREDSDNLRPSGNAAAGEVVRLPEVRSQVEALKPEEVNDASGLEGRQVDTGLRDEIIGGGGGRAVLPAPQGTRPLTRPSDSHDALVLELPLEYTRPEEEVDERRTSGETADDALLGEVSDGPVWQGSGLAHSSAGVVSEPLPQLRPVSLEPEEVNDGERSLPSDGNEQEAYSDFPLRAHNSLRGDGQLAISSLPSAQMPSLRSGVEALELPLEYTRDQAIKWVLYLREHREKSPWLWGDLYNECEQRFGSEFTDDHSVGPGGETLSEMSGLPYPTLQNYRRIAKAWPEDQRRAVSWRHHQKLYKHPDGGLWLDYCVTTGATLSDLSEVMGTKKPKVRRFTIAVLRENLAGYTNTPFRNNGRAFAEAWLESLE